MNERELDSGPQPHKLVMDYSPDEVLDFQQRYMQRLARSEMRAKQAMRWLTSSLICLAASALLPGVLRAVLALCGVLLICVSIHKLRTQRPPKCPACAASVDESIGMFCPECGGEVVASGSVGVALCDYCRKRLIVGEGRRYKIRRCTNCGVKLSNEGL